jgi:hypothetical protein
VDTWRSHSPDNAGISITSKELASWYVDFKDTIASKETVLIRKNVNVHVSFTSTYREALQVITGLFEGRCRLLSFAAAPQPYVFLKIVHNPTFQL